MAQKKTPLKERTWYPYAVAACIAVVLYVVLANLGRIAHGISTFFGFFSTVIIGCVIAYLVNPLARMYRTRVLKRVKKEKTATFWSNVLAFATVLLLIAFVLGMVIPQLIESVTTFAGNLVIDIALQFFVPSISSKIIDDDMLNGIGGHLRGFCQLAEQSVILGVLHADKLLLYVRGIWHERLAHFCVHADRPVDILVAVICKLV